ncbi:hypothetical protein AMAG_15486 [Allomyces macrogynus ATCC 38327]|uniref:F-box domain-containing protein n=1 Tax=Allomyces macrogynus (strain ATCC 38327) TaxID=578462 RepID=A0A0L0T7N0_ALLM3|nr:hypothetical protein AMAG_15486 [Allomyces macrogynus ATCC 38327]|eukprot:KNE70735.1 hypothetical protein AMAG_15486 [Allomyces macrogynus ATCC 38327]
MREPDAPVLKCTASCHADRRTPDPADPGTLSVHLVVCLTDVLALIFPYLTDDPVALFRASHVCSTWRSVIMDSHAARLWPAAYHRLPGLRCRDPPLEGKPTWQRHRWLALVTAFRDSSDWGGLNEYTDQLSETNVPGEHLVRLEQLHADEGEEPREPLVAVTENCVVFEPRLTGHVDEPRTRSVLQVQPFSSSTTTGADSPPRDAFLIHGSPDPVEEIDDDGALTNGCDPFFKSTGVTQSRWMWTQSATHVDLFTLPTANLFIRVMHPDRLRILGTSCCDDWLVVLYRVPLDWSRSFASDPEIPWRHKDSPDHMATPCILTVYDLPNVILPHVELDRCLRLDAGGVGIEMAAAVWVPYEHGLTHSVVDPDAVHPFAVTDLDPWVVDRAHPTQPCRQLLKVVVNEQGDDRIVGQRLVVITFDVTDPTAPVTLVAWQPYGIIPNHTTYSEGEPYNFAEGGTCCSFRKWRLFGRILIGSTREGTCCPPIQFARDDSGHDRGATLAPNLQAVLINVTGAGFFAISVLFREPLLRAFLFHDDWEHVLERYLANLCGHDIVLAAQYDLRLAELAYLRMLFPADTTDAALTTLSSLVRSTPLHALAHLPRLPRQGTWHHAESMHRTRQDRLVIVLRASPVQTLFATSSTAGHTAMTWSGMRVEVWDVAGMRMVKRVAMPRTTEFVIGPGVPNPVWETENETVGSGSTAAVRTTDEAVVWDLLLPPRRGGDGPWDDAWVLDVLAQSMGARKEEDGDEDGPVRHVYSPGTVLYVTPTCTGLAVVRSLGAMRGAAVEKWQYGRPRASVEGGI